MVLAVPTAALGLLLLEHTWYFATASVYVPLIAGWYISKRIHDWYVGYTCFLGVLYFRTVAAQVVPGFMDKYQEASDKITIEYMERWHTDKAFRLREIVKAGVLEEEKSDD